MISIDDFTEFTEGTSTAEDGLVDRCPVCGRNGLRRARTDGTVRFVHVESARMFAEGLRAEPEDSCLLPRRRAA